MRKYTFDKLFSEYYQQTLETSQATVSSEVSGSKPAWVQLLQSHIQEWKQHYGQQNEAIEQIRRKHRENKPIDSWAILADEEEVTRSFQIKREQIWVRQQQELKVGKAIN